MGAVFSTYTHKKIPLKYYIGLGSFLSAIGYTLFYLSPNKYIAGFSFLLLGFFFTYASTGFTTFFQNNIPQKNMGRVGTISDLFQGVIQILLTLLIGYLSEIISFQVVTVSFGLLSVFISIVLCVYLVKLGKEKSINLN